MVIRQVFPFAFQPSVHRTPPHIRLAVGGSIALHAAAVGYLAYATFNTPIAPVRGDAITRHSVEPPPRGTR